MFCNMCGQKLPDGSKFCINCGAKVAVPTPNAAQTHHDSRYSYVPPKDSAREVIYAPGKRPDILNARKPIEQETRTYCNSCGAELMPGMRFCTQCGKSVGAASKTPVKTTVTTVKDRNTNAKPKKSAMRIIAWILLVLNAISAVGGFSDGSILMMLHGGVAGIAELLGYFSPAIIAGILFHIDGKRNKK